MNYYPPPQPQTRPGKLFTWLAMFLTTIAFLCFATWEGDQSNALLLLADTPSILRIGVIGFIVFFVSHVIAIIGALLS